MLQNKLSRKNLYKLLHNCKISAIQGPDSADYFLEINSGGVLLKPGTVSDPMVIGEHDGIGIGFVLFCKKDYLTLECHGWGDIDLPEDIRFREFKINGIGRIAPRLKKS